MLDKNAIQETLDLVAKKLENESNDDLADLVDYYSYFLMNATSSSELAIIKEGLLEIFAVRRKRYIASLSKKGESEVSTKRRMVLCPKCHTIQKAGGPCGNCKFPIEDKKEKAEEKQAEYDVTLDQMVVNK
jgi:hypothetical protein